jgi:hypothetical protein
MFLDGESTWAFVLDTNMDTTIQRFREELFAFCTGHQFGHFRSDDEMVETFHREEMIDPFLDSDEEGWSIEIPPLLMGEDDPCESLPNPRWFSDGMGNRYPMDSPPPEEEMLEAYRSRRQEWVDSQAELLPEHSRMRSKHLDSEMAALRKRGVIIRRPSLTSVAFLFRSCPDEEQEAVIVRRAEVFFEKFVGGPIVIEGVRLLERAIVIREVQKEVPS